MTHATRALQSHDLSGRELNYGSHIYFLTTQEHGGPPRMSDQPNAGATSETAHTWKKIHTKRTLSHPNKANMEWWLRRPNDSPEGPVIQIHSPTSTLGPLGSFQNLKSVHMLKREWGAERSGTLPNLFIPSKTATLVPAFCSEIPTLGKTLRWWYNKEITWSSESLSQWCLICNINLLDRIHCLKCFFTQRFGSWIYCRLQVRICR